MKTAVVLSGGGAKGAYQIGVWKALRKLHIKYDIVTGTSVGALNGVLMVQNSFYRAMSIWKNISYKDILGEEFEEKVKDGNELEVYKEYAKSTLEGGLDVTALENMFAKNIKYWRFKLSKVDYGMITVNLKTLKHKEILKKDLNKNNIKDYVIASASCFPAFKAKKIDKNEYIDGGFYDNLPINMAIKMGAERVIAVDLKAPGFKQIVQPKDIQIDRIYPRNKINSFLVFDKEACIRNIDFGYNDTMKYYGYLDGNKFTFEKGSLKENYDKYEDNIVRITKRLSYTDNMLLNAIISFNEINNVLKEKNFSVLHNNIIEYLGKTYELDESKIYDMDTFNGNILYEFEKHGNVDKLTDKNIGDNKNIIAYIHALLNSREISVKKLVKLMLLYKKEFLGALYISALEIC